MISELSVKNFKCLRDIKVNLKPFTVLVGANGSGKTSFLQAINLLCRIFPVSQQQINQEFSINRSYGATSNPEISCTNDSYLFKIESNLLCKYAENKIPIQWLNWDLTLPPKQPQIQFNHL